MILRDFDKNFPLHLIAFHYVTHPLSENQVQFHHNLDKQQEN